MRKNTGFTIVELVVVIAVIGILATIGTVTYTNIRRESQNDTRRLEAAQWQSLFENYKHRYSVMPPQLVSAPSDDPAYCADESLTNCLSIAGSGGGDYPYTDPPGNQSLLGELKKVGSLPKATAGALPIEVQASPYTYRFQGVTITHNLFSWGYLSDYSVVTVLEGINQQCPDGFTATNDTLTNKVTFCFWEIT